MLRDSAELLLVHSGAVCNGSELLSLLLLDSPLLFYLFDDDYENRFIIYLMILLSKCIYTITMLHFLSNGSCKP